MPHIHEKNDFTVEVFIVHKNKVLLRMHDKYDIWLSVGGHIELDEGPTDAAVREAKEEVGLDIKLEDDSIGFNSDPEHPAIIPPKYMYNHVVSDTPHHHNHIVFVYFATSDTDELVPTVGDEKSVDMGWFTAEEIDGLNPIAPHTVFYAKKALEELSGFSN